jgi:hypothetical protein
MKFHGGDYEEWGLLGCYAKFLRNVGSYKSHTANISEDGILQHVKAILSRWYSHT